MMISKSVLKKAREAAVRMLPDQVIVTIPFGESGHMYVSRDNSKVDLISSCELTNLLHGLSL